jgi:two-component system, OmpR family, phosphate regulon sensor histidine kinase PhoR
MDQIANPGIIHRLRLMSTIFTTTQLEALALASPFATLVLNGEGEVMAANQSAEKLFGGLLKSRSLSLIIRSPDVLETFERVCETSETLTARSISRGLTQQIVDVHFAILATAENGKRLLIATCQDVTREENIERMRSDFVANASHELRTPLTTLSGFIETMQGAAKGDEKARAEFLKVMKVQADRMSRLIEDLLSLSRIELDEHVAPESLSDLTSIAKQVQALLKPMAEAAGSHLVVDLPATLMVTGDTSQLTQVVHNLVENALKYAGDGKHIRISGGTSEREVTLSVEDNGAGIAAHHVPRLTERFYRVNATDSRTKGGTGLGLAICKHILNRHRGRLVIESEPGQGSSFTVQLPFPKKPITSYN